VTSKASSHGIGGQVAQGVGRRDHGFPAPASESMALLQLADSANAP
jgi:hypothetical protein